MTESGDDSEAHDGILPAWLQPRPNSWPARILLAIMISALIGAIHKGRPHQGGEGRVGPKADIEKEVA